jgi:tRNA A37 threonylcarbamoyladenosine synthetase subunit TsaC/SUA5/YrdC
MITNTRETITPYTTSEVVAQTPVYDLNNPEHRAIGISALRDGQLIGAQIDGTFGLVAPAEKPETAMLINLAKGRNPIQQLTLFILPHQIEEIFSKIDPDRLSLEARQTLSTPQILNVIAQHFVTRLPLKVNSTISGTPLHPLISSNDAYGQIIQIFSPLDESGQALIRETKNQPRLLAISSMNRTGSGTIMDSQDAINFCSEQDIPLLLTSGKKPEPSYRIVSMVESGIIELRPGKGDNIDKFITEALLGLAS